MVIPPAYKLTIMSSTSVSRLKPLGTIVGGKRAVSISWNINAYWPKVRIYGFRIRAIAIVIFFQQ